MKKRILISTGGTGGHVISAIAFYEHLKKNFDVSLVVDKRGSKFVNKNKYEYKIIHSPRLTLNVLKLPITLINLLIYVLKSIFFPKNHMNKIFVIRHVLRKEIYNHSNIKKEKLKNSINLLILGGSQGANFFDQNLKNCIIDLSKKFKIKVYHQISTTDIVNLETFYNEHGIENKLFNFEDDIFKFIIEANLAISRAGASTLSEMAFLKVPFIAIPYRFATDDHQLENAIDYEKKGSCWILKEEEFNQDKLTTLLLSIIQNEEDYLIKKNNLEKFCYQNKWDNINEKLLGCLNEN